MLRYSYLAEMQCKVLFNASLFWPGNCLMVHNRTKQVQDIVPAAQSSAPRCYGSPVLSEKYQVSPTQLHSKAHTTAVPSGAHSHVSTPSPPV